MEIDEAILWVGSDLTPQRCNQMVVEHKIVSRLEFAKDVPAATVCEDEFVHGRFPTVASA